MSKPIEYKNFSNDKLIEMMGILDKNHEKVKTEILILVEILNQIQKDFVDINDELKSRT